MVKLSDSELVKLARGKRTQIEFAEALGVAQSMVSDWERDEHSPVGGTWIRMARLAEERYAIECWRRGGLDQAEINALVLERTLAAEKPEPEGRARLRGYMRKKGITPEDVILPLAPHPGEPGYENPSRSLEELQEQYEATRKSVEAARAGKPSTVEEFLARNKTTLGEGQIAGQVKPEKSAKKGKPRKRVKK